MAVRITEEQLQQIRDRQKRPAAAPTRPPKKRGPNKLEQDWIDSLRYGSQPTWLGYEAITLKLAHDCRYTPDVAWQRDGLLYFDEVKGFFRDDAKVKLKVAARLFPWATFRLITRVKGDWRVEIIQAE